MQERVVVIDIPKPHYTLLTATRSGLPDVMVVNDALMSFAHREVFAWHLCVTLEAEQLADNGMPSREESELLFQIGDKITQAVLSTHTSNGAGNVLFIARGTSHGTRELLFQVHDPEIADAALQALLRERSWPREWGYEMTEDREWSHSMAIFRLLPTAKDADV